jgi:hypothetical protein
MVKSIARPTDVVQRDVGAKRAYHHSHSHNRYPLCDSVVTRSRINVAKDVAAVRVETLQLQVLAAEVFRDTAKADHRRLFAGSTLFVTPCIDEHMAERGNGVVSACRSEQTAAYCGPWAACDR